MMPSDFEMLRPLDDEPRTPSTVDVGRAIADGRRRRRTRRAAGYAGAAVVTAFAVAGASFAGGLITGDTPQNAATHSAVKPKPSASKAPTPKLNPPTSCTIDQLPVPDQEPMALVSGGDPTGRYIVGRTYPKAGGYQAVIWHDGEVRKVLLPDDGLEEGLEDVNSSGTAVGWSFAPSDEDADQGQVPYVYRNGKVSKLPGVLRGSANAINDAGTIVGESGSGDALLWTSATAKPTRLAVPSRASESSAADIDEDGTVVGTVDGLPYVWLPDGSQHQLPLPNLGGRPALDATVHSIRNGWATGVATNGGGAIGAKARGEQGKGEALSEAVRWNVRTGEVREYAGLLAGANAVNAQGWQAGVDEQGNAVFVADKTTKLPSLAGQKKQPLANIASSLSDDGRTIGGQSDDATGTIQAVVWRCK
jgi:uncharacterized membrane protein